MNAETKTIEPGRWGNTLKRIDDVWVDLEVKVAVAVLLWEIGALIFWILLNGLSSGPAMAGTLVRAIVFGGLFGFIAQSATKRMVVATQRNVIVIMALIAGFAVARAFGHVGSGYFSNLLNWLQSASTLTLFGGLRGIATRLTLWLALLGASLATASGKHINIDVVMRFLPPRPRVYVAVATWVFASVVCLLAAVGFADHIAIASFKAPAFKACEADTLVVCDVSPRDKFAHVADQVKLDGFVLRAQLSLDVKTIPKVLHGDSYSTYLKAPEWNAWLRSRNWAAYYPADQIDQLMMVDTDSEATRSPMVLLPGGSDSATGLLIREANFLFPFGLAAIALRFLMRAMMALAGKVRVDPDAAHEEEGVGP